MSRINLSVSGILGIWLISSAASAADNSRNALWAAVRNSDVAASKAALDAGADVNAKNEMGITALWIACGKDKLDVIQTLLDRGADVNARDFIWYQTPLSSALGVKNIEIIKTLLKAGARDIEPAVLNTANGSNVAILQVLLDTGKVRPEVLNAALYAAKNKEIQDALKKAGAVEPKTYPEAEREAWKPYAGAYESDNGGALVIEVKDVGLIARAGIGSGGSLMVPKGNGVFASVGSSDPAGSYTFEMTDGKVSRMIVKRFTAEMNFFRSASPTASIRRRPGMSKTMRTSAGRRRSLASAIRAPRSGAIASSSRRRSAVTQIRKFGPAITATLKA
jgi:hypothetical protein